MKRFELRNGDLIESSDGNLVTFNDHYQKMFSVLDRLEDVQYMLSSYIDKKESSYDVVMAEMEARLSTTKSVLSDILKGAKS